MKIIPRFRAVLLTGLVLIVAGYLAFWSLLFSGCGGNEEAAEQMRALSDERLKSLSEFAQDLYESHSEGERLSARQIQPIPSELAYLNPRAIRFFGDTFAVQISGCMDDKVYLFVKGMDQQRGPKKVLLSPGDGQGEEVLWEQ